MPSNILFINFEFPGHKYASLHNAQLFRGYLRGESVAAITCTTHQTKLLRNSWTDLSDMDLTSGAHETRRAVLPENRSEATATDGQISAHCGFFVIPPLAFHWWLSAGGDVRRQRSNQVRTPLSQFGRGVLKVSVTA